MNFDPERDLEITRVIRAPRSAVWAAWTNPASFEQWWIPAPARCRVQTMDIRPGGSLVTLMSEAEAPFSPHMNACYLDVEPGRRIVFTNALVGGWRPAADPFMTAVITLDDHDLGTAYRAVAMHRSPDDQAKHRDLGFFDGWGTVTEQLARLVEN